MVTGGGVVLLVLPAFLPSVISFLFTQRGAGRRGGGGGPSPRSVTGLYYDRKLIATFSRWRQIIYSRFLIKEVSILLFANETGERKSEPVEAAGYR